MGRSAHPQPAGQAQRDQHRPPRRADRRDPRGGGRSGGPGRRHRRCGPGVLRGLRPRGGVRLRRLDLARDAGPRRRRDAGDLALLEAGHRPGPWLRARRWPRAGDGLRPGGGLRRRPPRRARDPVRFGSRHLADAVPHRPEGHPRAAHDGRPRRCRGGAPARARQSGGTGGPPGSRGRRAGRDAWRGSSRT